MKKSTIIMAKMILNLTGFIAAAAIDLLIIATLIDFGCSYGQLDHNAFMAVFCEILGIGFIVGLVGYASWHTWNKNRILYNAAKYEESH